MARKYLLLIIIYLTFISLGLPDSLLGSAWPKMYLDLHVPKSYAGIIAMIIAAGTVISSLLSAKVIHHFSVASVTTSSIFLTVVALLGFAYSHYFIFLCLLAIPLGIGAGGVDAALNNYVALHYKAKHMNWLHCFWGIGAAIGPLIMARYLDHEEHWNNGYAAVGWIQSVILIILLCSLSLWKKEQKQSHKDDTHPSYKTLFQLPGLKEALIIFFCYCSIEATFGLWGASYLVFTKHEPPDHAARLIALYYLGITAGRFISGLFTVKFTNKQMIYAGQCIILLGLIALVLPFKILTLPGFLLIGIGCAPIFPSLLHDTPVNFGKKYAQAIMGMQIASAYIGITLMPFLFGKIATFFDYSILLWFIGILLLLKIIMTFQLNKKIKE